MPDQHLSLFRLDERQESFVHQVSNGIPSKVAAEKAGYTESESWRLLRHPRVAAAIEQELRRLLLTRDAPLALHTLRTLMKDEKSGARVRVDAAKILLDRAGFTPPVHEKGEGAERQLSDMTAAELKEFIGKHESEIERVTGELAARATPVNAHDNAPIDEAMPLNSAAFLD